MTNYIGILDGAGKVWGVRIPDLPGCHGGGGSQEEAIADAMSAALDWVEHQRARGTPIPSARRLSAVLSDPDVEFDPKSEVAVMIPVIVDQGRPAKANISLDAGLLSAIDEAARQRGLTRSAFIASAARTKILEG